MTPLYLLLTLFTPLLASVQYPNCTGTPSTQPVLSISPQLNSSVPNGMKYTVQSSLNNSHLTIVALKGSWYDIGYAYGQLMKEEINDAIPGMFDYLLNQTESWYSVINQSLPFYLKWIPNLLSLNNQELLYAVLNLQHQLTAPYTPKRFNDQLQGMADGAGINVTLLTGMNLFPELIRAQCTIIGTWGSATTDERLLQVRALDWDYQAYIVRFPTASIYFPEEEGSNSFATFGFAGMVGAISGYSSKVALSQKVWMPISTDPRSEFGEPFAYLLRDMLQFGNDLESAVGVLFGSPRTCKTHVGVGSKKDNNFEGIQMSWNEMDIFDDKNYTYTDAHPQMNGVMYWDKYIQPSGDFCLGSILKENLGKIDAEFLYRDAAPIHETGDTQLIVYQFENDTVYIAYGDPETLTKAYTRPMMQLDMGKLLTYESFF